MTTPPAEEEPVALCPTCRTPIPCHCHLTPAVQLRPGVYAARSDTRSDTMTTDQTAADARARIADALSPMTVVGGTPPQLLVPVIDGSKARMARIADWQPLDALVDAVLAAVSVPPPPPARSATRGLSVPHRDALWDAVAPPGPARPTFPEQHERVCRAVAEILDEVAPPVPAADRAVVLREAADRFDEIADELAATQERGRGVFFLERPVIRDAEVWSAAAKELRRLADEEQPATEAHPPSHTWKVESPRRDQWASWGATYDERVWAAASFEDVVEVAPQRPFRLVRATTTYTVEAEHTPPAPVAQQPAAEAWVCKCPAGLCGCGHHAPTEQQPAAADTDEEQRDA